MNTLMYNNSLKLIICFRNLSFNKPNHFNRTFKKVLDNKDFNYRKYVAYINSFYKLCKSRKILIKRFNVDND